MSKIDISQWKEFKVSDILNINSSKHIYHAKNLYIEDSKLNNKYYPYVVRTEFNNGIRGYIEEDRNTLNSGNTISLAQDTAQFFYQEEPYFTGNKIKICALNDDTVELTKNKALFLISALYKAFATFSYDSSFDVTRLNKVIIKLPVDKNGDPDWQYMDEYIAKLATQAHTNISLLRQQPKKAPTVNIDRWKEFKLTKLFEPHHGKRLTKRNRVSGDVPFLTAGFDSQGVKGYLAGNFEIWHNPISIDMFGNCFYHECDCAGDDNVYALVNNDMTSNVKLFIAGVLNKQLSIQFSYKDQFRQHDLDVLSIKLPTDSAGNPDWHYMDEYIAKLATQAHANISLLLQQQKKAPTVNIGVARKTYGKRNVQQ